MRAGPENIWAAERIFLGYFSYACRNSPNSAKCFKTQIRTFVQTEDFKLQILPLSDSECYHDITSISLCVAVSNCHAW